MRVRAGLARVLIITWFVLGVICLVRTARGEEKTYLQTINLEPRKTVVYDADGKEQGYFRKSYLDSRKTVYVPKGD